MFFFPAGFVFLLWTCLQQKHKGQILHISKTFQDLCQCKLAHDSRISQHITLRKYQLSSSCLVESCSSTLSSLWKVRVKCACQSIKKRGACRVGVSVGGEETAGAKHCGWMNLRGKNRRWNSRAFWMVFFFPEKWRIVGRGGVGGGVGKLPHSKRTPEVLTGWKWSPVATVGTLGSHVWMSLWLFVSAWRDWVEGHCRCVCACVCEREFVKLMSGEGVVEEQPKNKGPLLR